MKQPRRKRAKMGRPPLDDADREIMAAMGERLRWVREALGMSQEQIAILVGVHQTSWSKYELGQRMPHPAHVIRFCGKLHITVPYLLSGKLEDVGRDLAIHLAARHPELVPPTSTVPHKGKRLA
jgi:transcriptional regulator with XRE-family HTH domain